MLKEAHYWAEIGGDDSLQNSFSPWLSSALPPLLVSFRAFSFAPFVSVGGRPDCNETHLYSWLAALQLRLPRCVCGACLASCAAARVSKPR